MKTSNRPVLATDLGGVVFTNGDRKRPLDGAFKALRRLTSPDMFGEDNVHVISRVDTIHSTIRSKRRLMEHKFQEETGIHPSHWHYCYERHEKAPITKALQVTHMIDDRPEVLAYMDGIVPYRLLFCGDERDFVRFEPQLGGVIRVQNWEEVRLYFEEHFLGVALTMASSSK